MSGFPAFDDHDAVGLASLVAAGDVTPSQLLEEVLSRIDRVDHLLNAIVHRDDERAHAIALDPPDGPFRGVPFLVKDLAIEAGVPVTYGSVFLRDFVAPDSSEMVRRMLATGVVPAGRTNTPEFGLVPTTEPVLHGPTRNPWDTDRSSGGSSGGAAAAVAAGIVPMAHASDGGGSIRIPASACGVFGLKPSRGRMPRIPASTADFLATTLCVSRTVRDTAAFLDATHGAPAGDPYRLAPPPTAFVDQVGADPGSLRIAFTATSIDGSPLDHEVASAVRATAKRCEELGHHVVEASPPLDAAAVESAFLALWAALAESAFKLILDTAATRAPIRLVRRGIGDWRTMKLLSRLQSRGLPHDAFEPFTWGLVDHSRRTTAADLAIAMTRLQEATYAIARFMGEFDIWLTPTLGTPPVAIGEIDQTADWEDLRAQLTTYVPFTPIANFAGVPAMSVPLDWSEAGVPIGSHFMARLGDESSLIRLASQLESAHPWARRRPPVHAATT
jgi:amidase